MENQENLKSKEIDKKNETGGEWNSYSYYFNRVFDGSNYLYANAYAIAMTT